MDIRLEIENNIREMKRDYKRMRIGDILVLTMAVIVIVMCGVQSVWHFSEGRFVLGGIFIALIALNIWTSGRLIRSMIQCNKSFKNLIESYEELLRDMDELGEQMKKLLEEEQDEY